MSIYFVSSYAGLACGFVLGVAIGALLALTPSSSNEFEVYVIDITDWTEAFFIQLIVLPGLATSAITALVSEYFGRKNRIAIVAFSAWMISAAILSAAVYLASFGA